MKRLTAAVIAVVCSLGLVANAAARDHRGGRDHGPRHERSWHKGHDRHHHHHRRGYDRGPRGGPPAWHRGPPPRVIVVPPPRGPRWSRGERLPHRYMAPHHVVDWRRHNFRPPPRGHHWVHVNGEYLLVGIATGLILQAIAGR